MRVNIYSQELVLDPQAVELVEQTADNGVTYSGVRLFLHSSNRLHDTPDDDDRSAVTFWLPKSAPHRVAMAGVLNQAAWLIMQAKPETGLD